MLTPTLANDMDKDLKTGALALGKRPALILVDLSLGFCSPQSPLGGEFKDVVQANLQLLSLFRQHNWPVFFTTVVYQNKEQASVFRQRLPDLNILQQGSDWTEIHPDLNKQQNEYLIEKQGPSGFFATPLVEQLRLEQADSLVITGLTTSGCVRATVVDALQYNYPVFVPKQACGDRNASAHDANLHDMHAKYAEVLGLDALMEQLSSL
jgi:nicotinamidase-related amidase